MRYVTLRLAVRALAGRILWVYYSPETSYTIHGFVNSSVQGIWSVIMVAFSMCPVVHRINFPVGRTVVVAIYDSIDNRIPHRHVCGLHVDLARSHVF
jgi:hypothetical protein